MVFTQAESSAELRFGNRRKSPYRNLPADHVIGKSLPLAVEFAIASRESENSRIICLPEPRIGAIVRYSNGVVQLSTRFRPSRPRLKLSEAARWPHSMKHQDALPPLRALQSDLERPSP